MATMRSHLIEVHKRAAAHHASMAERHTTIAALHKSFAKAEMKDGHQALADEHEQCASEHADMAEFHKNGMEACSKGVDPDFTKGNELRPTQIRTIAPPRQVVPRYGQPSARKPEVPTEFEDLFRSDPDEGLHG